MSIAAETVSQSISAWRANPDLMDRLIAAQNHLIVPVDIVTFAGMCDSREELERHVVRYEGEVRDQKPVVARRSSRKSREG